MTQYKTAVIDEPECIGCTKCIQICPYDAIIGANKQIHTVLKAECTGCGLCIDPCPVDCITMIDVNQPLFDIERAKYRRKNRRERLRKHGILDQKMEISKEEFAELPAPSEIKLEIQKAYERVKAKKTK